jgi:hypothetical protein
MKNMTKGKNPTNKISTRLKNKREALLKVHFKAIFEKL